VNVFFVNNMAKLRDGMELIVCMIFHKEVDLPRGGGLPYKKEGMLVQNFEKNP